MALLLRRMRDTPLGPRIAVASASAVVGALLHAVANFGIFYLLMPEESMERASLASYLAATTVWFWTYGTIAALLLVIYYHADLRERDQRLTDMRAIAQSAQIKALRYQINPHFMFNTLNSIASLIGRKETDDAETMVEDLSEFLHTTLQLNPEEDIPLSRELELQKLYLSIETARFPDRLRVEVDVPEALNAILVPSLITQPLVENVIKHAVRKSTVPITLRIAALRGDGMIELTIRNSLGDAAGMLRGPPGIGLANVSERLAMRYPGASRCVAVSDDGGFHVRVTLPAVESDSQP
jgi:LytS/YehU family sensor histidine kinase